MYVGLTNEVLPYFLPGLFSTWSQPLGLFSARLWWKQKNPRSCSTATSIGLYNNNNSKNVEVCIENILPSVFTLHLCCHTNWISKIQTNMGEHWFSADSGLVRRCQDWNVHNMGSLFRPIYEQWMVLVVLERAASILHCGLHEKILPPKVDVCRLR